MLDSTKITFKSRFFLSENIKDLTFLLVSFHNVSRTCKTFLVVPMFIHWQIERGCPVQGVRLTPILLLKYPMKMK